MKRLLLAITLVFVWTGYAVAVPPVKRFAVAELPTPVLNTPEFGQVFGGTHGRSLLVDACGQIRALEFVAYPGTVFYIREVLRRGGALVYRVTTDEYPYATKTGYFIDSRFVRLSAVKPPERFRQLADRREIIERLLAAQGTKYLWGGNFRAGVPQVLLFHPPAGPLFNGSELQRLWILRGLDCSGLLYEATDGWTPRNTSVLMEYGEPLLISGLKAEQIQERVEPLDLIVWHRHVMIVIDQELVIESRPDCSGGGGGVVVRPLAEALREIMTQKVPANRWTDGPGGRRNFVIRRWYGRPGAFPGASIPPRTPVSAPASESVRRIGS